MQDLKKKRTVDNNSLVEKMKRRAKKQRPQKITIHMATLKVWSRQAWLQPMHVLMLATSPLAALFTISGSAKNGRAMETKSASPFASTAST